MIFCFVPEIFKVSYYANSCYWSWARRQIFLCLERHTNEAKVSIQCRIDPFASFACQTADICDKSYLATDDVTGCASTVVWHKIENISTNNAAMLLKLGRDVAPCKIYLMVHILMLLWQHARFQDFPLSSKSNINTCSCMGQNIQLKMFKRRLYEGGTGIRLTCR